MVKSGIAYIMATCIQAIWPFILLALPVMLLRDGLGEAVTGGFLGAVSMWLWVRPKFLDGLARVSLGMIAVFVFFERQFPLAATIFGGGELSALQNGFLYGGLGAFVVGYAIDFWMKKTGKA